MPKFKPLHGAVILAVFIAALIGLEGKWKSPHVQVAPGPDGIVRIDVADLKPLAIRYYRFLNSANQEVKFFVARDESGTLQVAFDAAENHFKLRRGFRLEDGWIIDNKCDTATRLAAVNGGGGGCSPIPLPHRVVGGELQISSPDLLQGWRLFR